MNGLSCPWCGTPTYTGFVEVGVGYYECGNCGAYELRPDINSGLLTEVEQAMSWRGPMEDYPIFSPFNPNVVQFEPLDWT